MALLGPGCGGGYHRVLVMACGWWRWSTVERALEAATGGRAALVMASMAMSGTLTAVAVVALIVGGG